MTHDEVLSLLFPGGHAVKPGPAGTIDGSGKVKTGGDVTVVGIVGGTPLSVDAAIHLASCVLSTVREGGKRLRLRAQHQRQRHRAAGRGPEHADIVRLRHRYRHFPRRHIIVHGGRVRIIRHSGVPFARGR
jgi:hypothetical protein